MADPKTLLDEGGKLQKVRIELNESSGPVSPRFQYEVRVLIEGGGGAEGAGGGGGDEGGLTLTFDQEGEREVAIKRSFSRAELEALWAKLVDAGALSLGDMVGDAGRAKTGVSFNSLDIVVGSVVNVHFEYTLNRIKLPEEAPRKKVVDIVKALGEGSPKAAG